MNLQSVLRVATDTDHIYRDRNSGYHWIGKADDIERAGDRYAVGEMTVEEVDAIEYLGTAGDIRSELAAARDA